jgi:hypothetical protein
MKAKSSRLTTSIYTVEKDNKEEMDMILTFVVHQIISAGKVTMSFFFHISRPMYPQSILISSLYQFLSRFLVLKFWTNIL